MTEPRGMIGDPSILPNINLVSVEDRSLDNLFTKGPGFVNISPSSGGRRRKFPHEMTFLKDSIP